MLHCPADPSATALLVSDGRDRLARRRTPTRRRPTRWWSCGGALVTPAFVDAHVHATDTGLALSGLDLSAAAVGGGAARRRWPRSPTALPADAVVLGHGWDESTLGATGAAATRRSWTGPRGGRRVYLSQASIHSALVSPALLAAAPGGRRGAGVRRVGLAAPRRPSRGAGGRAGLGDRRRSGARRSGAALAHAASLGIAAVHECGGPGTSDEDDFTGVAGARRATGLPEVYGYWGELMGAAQGPGARRGRRRR